MKKTIKLNTIFILIGVLFFSGCSENNDLQTVPETKLSTAKLQTIYQYKIENEEFFFEQEEFYSLYYDNITTFINEIEGGESYYELTGMERKPIYKKNEIVKKLVYGENFKGASSKIKNDLLKFVDFYFSNADQKKTVKILYEVSSYILDNFNDYSIRINLLPVDFWEKGYNLSGYRVQAFDNTIYIELKSPRMNEWIGQEVSVYDEGMILIGSNCAYSPPGCTAHVQVSPIPPSPISPEPYSQMKSSENLSLYDYMVNKPTFVKEENGQLYFEADKVCNRKCRHIEKSGGDYLIGVSLDWVKEN